MGTSFRIISSNLIYNKQNVTMAKKAAAKEGTPKKASPKSPKKTSPKSPKKATPKKNQKTESPQKEKRPTPAAFTKKFKLSKDLSAIIGKKEASRPEITKELWAYLKKNNLQDPEAKQWFTPDKKMAKVFGTEKMKGFAMTKFINSHLSEATA